MTDYRHFSYFYLSSRSLCVLAEASVNNICENVCISLSRSFGKANKAFWDEIPPNEDSSYADIGWDEKK